MSSVLTLAPHEWNRFSVPHALRLLGEHQHLVGAGSVALATTLRLRVRAEETQGPFAIDFGRAADNEAGWEPLEGDAVAERAVRWERAIAELIAPGPDELAGLRVRVDFGPLALVCPGPVLLAAPAVALGLTVAALAFRAERGPIGEAELARLACDLKIAADPAGLSHPDRFHSEMIQSVLGGAAHVTPEGERLNVQQLLPPESMLLAIAAEPAPAPVAPEPQAEVREALDLISRQGRALVGGQTGLGELFRLGENVLNDRQMGLLYGLMRVREMTDAVIEHLTEGLLDNDRLAEACDEESAVLTDYFGFPSAPYDGIRTAAGEAGALGGKLTWAFGGCPAAIIMAPGRRHETGQALARAFPRAHFLLVDTAPEGLIPGDEKEPDFTL